MLVETLLRRALDRGRLDRYRRSDAFEDAVRSCLEEASLQPFGSPLAVAQGHAANSWLSPEQRCVWEEVAHRISSRPACVSDAFAPSEADPFADFDLGPVPLAYVSPPAPPPEPTPPPAPVFETYAVGVRTEVGPGSPGAHLRDLATEALAKVSVDVDAAGEPWLLYRVEASILPDLLAPLRLAGRAEATLSA